MLTKTIPHLKFTFLLLFITLTCIIHADNTLKFDHIALPPDVVNAKVKCILEDDRGMMWFGLSSGLICYDGYKVKSIENVNEAGEQNSFGDVRALVEASNNHIWVGTNNGIFIYNKRSQVTRMLTDPHLRHKVCRTLYRTQDNEIVIGTEGGLLIYNEDGTLIEQYIHQAGLNKGLSHNVVRCFYEDAHKRLWIGTYDRLNLLDRQEKKFTHYRLQRSDSLNHRNNLILSIQPYEKTSDSLLIIGTETGLCLLNTVTGTFEQYKHHQGNNAISNSVVKTVCVQDSRMWIGTDLGLNMFDPGKQHFENFYHDYKNTFSPSSNVINQVHLDKLNNLWLATNDGIDKTHLTDQTVLWNRITPNTEPLKGELVIKNISLGHNGDVWIATGEGLIHYQNKEQRYKRYLPPLILHNKVNDVFCDSNNMVWIATAGGLNTYNVTKDQFEAYVANDDYEKSLETNYVNCIEQDSEGNVYLGTFNKGLHKVVETEGGAFEFINYHHQEGNSNSLISNKIFDLKIDNSDNVWIATSKGVSHLDVVSGVIECFSDQRESPVNHFVSQLFLDENSTVWVASNKGLYFRRPDDNQFRIMEQLPANINSVAVLDSIVYFVTKNSFHLFNIKTNEQICIPNVKLGLSSVTDIKVLNDGRMILSGNKGFVSLNKNGLKVDSLMSKVHWMSFSILNEELKPFLEKNGRKILEKQIDETDYIELNYSENTFSVEFSALQYSFEKSCSYQYILEGYDDLWQTSKPNTNYVTYTQVRPGTYKLKVKASNPYGIYADQARIMTIKVNPPLYFSRWAVILYFCLLLVLLVVLRRMLVIREKHLNDLRFQTLRRQKSEELVEIKTRFFTNISHELKTPLTLISSPVDDLLAKELDEPVRNALQLVKRSTDRLKKLVNEILDIRKIETGSEKLHLQEYDIIRFTDRVMAQFKSEAERRDMLLQYYASQTSLMMNFDMEKIEKVLINLISNAFKFTPNGGVISIRVKDGRAASKKKNKLYISVTDNGCGISLEDQSNVFNRFHSLGSANFNSQQGTGIGLSLVKDYVTLHGGKVKLKSTVNKGCCFTFSIPFDLEPLERYRQREFVPEDKVPPKETELQEAEGNALDAARLKALVVEDDNDMRAYLVNGLSEHYEVVVAGNGRDGWQKTLAEVPDIIISDWMMPVMSGIELCQEIKGDIRTCHIPLILLTAKGGMESHVEGMVTGADDYMQKPFNMAYLIVRMENLLEQRNRLKKIFMQQVNLEPSEIAVSSLDEWFLNDLKEHMEKEMDNSELSVRLLSEKMGMSHTNLYRKIKALTGQSASEFMRTFRLKRAAQLLKNEQLNVTDVMYMVGFSHRSYFTKSFKAMYGVSPKDYR